MKRYVNILKWSMLLIYFPVIMAFVSFNNSSLVCSGVEVTVTDSLTTNFVSGSEVRKIILSRFPEMLGSPMRDIDFEAIESSVKKHLAIRSCQVYNNAYGIVNVKISQHEPIMRVFSGNNSFYLDENGVQIPVSGRFSSRVMVVNGNIPKDTDDLLYVARLIRNNSFWNAQIEQIYIRRNNDYVLVPRVGEHLILVGSSERFEEKMNNLMLLYQQLDPKEWNNYKSINLKFKNQVICSKSGL